MAIAVCAVLAAISIAVIVRSFERAFPEASIDFRYDRETSRAIAERLITAQRFDLRDMKHASRFDSDEDARIFLERSLGLENAGRVMRDKVRLWSWHHRWYRPLVEEEISVDVAPTGEIVAFDHTIPEERAMPGTLAGPPVGFLVMIGVPVGDLRLVSMSERRLPQRVQRIYTWESQSIRPAGAAYRHTVVVDGRLVTGYSQRLKVPDAWLRSYRELRAKNLAAGQVDTVFTAITMIAAVVIFVVRLRRGDLHLRFLLGVGLAAIVLVGGVELNQMPAQLAYYDTATSYPAFIAQLLFGAFVRSLGTAMLLIVICGAGEVLYRERLPKQLAVPRVWNRRALRSRRVFLALVVGYALVPIFIAYQVVFYLTAQKYGAWAPAEVPYDEMLNSALPWMVVLFAGFFPAFSEEFLSRAFSIPFFQRVLRSRITAIVVAAFIWGFGHSTYANQPFWIRGVEVGLVGIVAGLLMDRIGLLPLLIWHYTVDAVYTATLLFGSGNAYYVASAAATSLIVVIPLVASIALYVRHEGFAPDDDLSNERIPIEPPPPHPEVAAAAVQFPPPMRITRGRVLLCVALIALACAAVVWRAPSPQDAIDYRISAARAKEIAKAHLGRAGAQYVIAAPVEGFRVWDASSPREDGGAPGGFDDVAATHLIRNGMRVAELTRIFRERLETGVWTVRFFTPMKKEEIFVEVDPRTSRVTGYHKYQDEQNPGPSLEQGEALARARAAFARYGVDVGAFDIKEALSFQQPRRRDWLFHFEERTPLAPGVFRRVTVRVAGGEVTQFNKHVKAPESIYREATKQTFLNVVLIALKVAGTIGLFALVIAGVVLASRAHGLPWRRALRWSLILSIIPIASLLAGYELMLFGYSTSTTWETFRVRVATELVIEIGKQIGLLFIALAGLEAAVPYALSLVRREGRARFGRAAAVAALTAIAIVVLVDTGLQWVEALWPAAASVELAVSDVVAMPLPALFEAADSLTLALALSAAIALYAVALRKHVALVTVIGVFCATLDPFVSQPEIPLMLARAAVLALMVWVIGRWVLDGNPLAWPLAFFLAVTLQSAAPLLESSRADLVANAIALVVIAFAVLAWIASPRSADA